MRTLSYILKERAGFVVQVPLGNAVKTLLQFTARVTCLIPAPRNGIPRHQIQLRQTEPFLGADPIS